MNRRVYLGRALAPLVVFLLAVGTMQGAGASHAALSDTFAVTEILGSSRYVNFGSGWNSDDECSADGIGSVQERTGGISWALIGSGADASVFSVPEIRFDSLRGSASLRLCGDLADSCRTAELQGKLTFDSGESWSLTEAGWRLLPSATGGVVALIEGTHSDTAGPHGSFQLTLDLYRSPHEGNALRHGVSIVSQRDPVETFCKSDNYYMFVNRGLFQTG